MLLEVKLFFLGFYFYFYIPLFFYILSSKFLLLALHAWVICALQWIWTNYIKWLLLISVFFSIHLYHFFFFFLHWFLDFSFLVNSTNRSYHLHLYHILFSFFSFLFPQHSAPDKKASLINCQPIKRDGPLSPNDTWWLHNAQLACLESKLLQW